MPLKEPRSARPRPGAVKPAAGKPLIYFTVAYSGAIDVNLMG
jgi:hypothetical protein